MANRSLVDVMVAKDHRTVMTHGGTTSGGSVMRVTLKNLAGTTETFRLWVEGLPADWASLELNEVSLEPGQELNIPLRVNPTEYRKGLYPFEVKAQGMTTGASASFKTVHVVGN